MPNDFSTTKRLYESGEPAKAISQFNNVDESELLDAKYLRIYHLDKGGGFFVNLLYVINGIIFAEKNGLIPFVNITHRALPYFDINHGDNIWEYYFEPISDINYSNLAFEEVRQINEHDIAKHQFHKKYQHGIQVYPYHKTKHANKRSAYDAHWYVSMRSKAHDILNRYVRIKPHILDKVEEFYNDYFSTCMLGIHIRTTDKKTKIGGRQIGAEEYFPHIEEYLAKNPEAKIFCATDSNIQLEILSKKFGDLVVSYDSLRHESNVFTVKDIEDNYKKGEDALIDCLLLSRCNFLMKPSSAVSEFATYFNLDLHNNLLELQYLNGYD